MRARIVVLLTAALAGCAGCTEGAPPPVRRAPPERPSVTIAVPRGQVLCAAFDPSGATIATGTSNDRLQLWSARTGELVAEGRGHRRGITGVAFAPDGKRLATAGPDRTVRLWTVEPLAEQRVLRGPERPVDRLAWSAGGERVVAASMAGELVAWDATSGELLHARPGPALRGVRCLAITSTGERVAWAADGGTLRVWDGATGEKLAGLRDDRLQQVVALAITEDGALAATATDEPAPGELLVWDLAAGRLAARCRDVPGPVRALAFDRAGERLASAHADGLGLWDASTGQRIAAFPAPEGGAAQVAFDAGGERLVAAGPGATAQVWDVAGLTWTGPERGAPLDAPLATGDDVPLPVPEVGPDGRLDLALLAIPGYDPPELRPEGEGPMRLEDFPPAVRALDGRTVHARGYPIAAELERGEVHRFLLSRFPPGCCFGAVPVLDEWIAVTVEEGVAPLDPNVPVEVSGGLEVGEVLGEDGFAVSLYRMRAERVR